MTNTEQVTNLFIELWNIRAQIFNVPKLDVNDEFIQLFKKEINKVFKEEN